MSANTPTVLRKILARKLEEIAERSLVVPISALIDKAQVCLFTTRLCGGVGSQIGRGAAGCHCGN